MLSILAAILLLGILITMHELGHFLAARACGIAVREYSIGFGPQLFHRTADGEILDDGFVLQSRRPLAFIFLYYKRSGALMQR